MKRRNAESIGQLIHKFLRQESLEGPLNERRLLDSWAAVMGAPITTYTTQLYIRNQTLYVHLSSAVLRQELLMGKSLIIRKLNEHVGAMVIVNIVFC
jgi:predicted nucleic acid-binding Zn ribbon protein